MTAVNHAEIEAIIGYIEANPEEWRQAAYGKRTDCGTAYCVAGHACLRAGFTMRWNVVDDDWCSSQLTSGDHIATKAVELLGLNRDQSYSLFRGDNTIDDLKRVAKSFHDNEQL